VAAVSMIFTRINLPQFKGVTDDTWEDGRPTPRTSFHCHRQ